MMRSKSTSIVYLIICLLFLAFNNTNAKSLCSVVPLANSDSYTLKKNEVLVIEKENGVLINDVSPNGLEISVLGVNPISRYPTHGTIRLNTDGSFRYSSDFDFFGVDNFSYNITDGCDDSVTSGEVTITVDKNNKPPEIAIRGNNPEYLDLGQDIPTSDDVTAVDIEDRDVTNKVESKTNLQKNVKGKYEIVYSVSDSDGAFAYATRTVMVGFQLENTAILCADDFDNDFDGVKDFADSKCPNFGAAPTINIIGSSTEMLKIGNTFIDSGATAIDTLDGDITKNISTSTDLNNTKSGTYYFLYSVKDSDNYFAYATRTILVSNESENTQILCSDTFDNDGDSKKDLDDTDCSLFIPKVPALTSTSTPASTPAPIQSPSGGGGGSSGSIIIPANVTTFNNISTSSVSTTTAKTTQGKVLGANITCGPVLTLGKDYLAKGKNNNRNQLIALKKFLNKNLKLKIELNGAFGPMTEKAVKDFQVKYKDDILKPLGLTQPTGKVFSGTANYINYLECPALGFSVSKK